MKKTLTINLGGIVFNIDDDAFVVLKSYLDTIRGYFDTSEGRDEIMTDIESRIAEMLQEKLSGGKEVVNTADINQVISVMGQPEDYISEDLEDEPQQSRQKSTYTYTTKKRLFRDPDSSMIGGVSSGIGYYFGIDPIWIRLLFIIAVFAGFSGILIYIILWIIMPEARTPSEKLAMRGEPVTFDNIGKTVEDQMDNLKKKLNNLDEDHVRKHRDNIHSGASKAFDFIGDLLKMIIKVIGKILGFFFIFIPGIMLIVLLVMSFSPVNNIFIDSDNTTIAYSLMELSNMFFTTGSNYWMAMIGGVLFLGIPLLGLILAGLTLLFNVRYPKYTGLAMAGAWVMGIIISTAGGISTSMDFGKEASTTEIITLNETTSDTITLELMDENKQLNYHKGRNGFFERFEIKDGILTTDGIKVDVLPSNNNSIQLEVIKSSRGNSFENAEQRAANINYNVALDSNTVLLNPFYSFSTEDKWRNQEISVNLYLPVNKTVYIPRNFKYLLDDVKNYTTTYDHNMVGHYWTMTDSGLVCPYFMNKTSNNLDWIEELDEDHIQINIHEDGEEHTITIGN